MFATDSDAVREYARNYGMDNPSEAWILDPRDCWSPNPYYTGPKVRHPEDDYPAHDAAEDEAEYQAWLISLAPEDETQDDFPW